MLRRSFLKRMALSMVVVPALRWLPAPEAEEDVVEKAYSATLQHFTDWIKTTGPGYYTDASLVETHLDLSYNFWCQSRREMGSA